MWEATALGIVVATLVGAAFVGGCFCGSWVQRTIGYVIRTRAEKELLDSATEREEGNYLHRRTADWQAQRRVKAEEAAEHVHSPPPTDSPLGPGLPSPDELDNLLGDRSPRDFTSGLSTEQLREAHGR